MLFSAISLIIVCFPTSLLDPFAEVINISPFLANGIFTASIFTNTSSLDLINWSSSIFEERKTLMPFSAISEGL